MAIITPGSFLQNGGSVPAQFERLRNSFMTKPFPTGSTNVNTRLDGRGGVWLQANALNITAQGTPNMTVNVDRGGALIPATENVLQGGYPAFNDGLFVVPITASNTSDRIDSLVMHVKDTVYSGVSDLAEFTTVLGSPGSGVPPDLTTLDKNYLEIGRITVRANTTQILSTDITDRRHWLTAPGGIQIARSFELGDNGATAGDWRDTGTTLDRWNGTSWDNQVVTGSKNGSAKWTAAITSTGQNQAITNTITWGPVQFINNVWSSPDVTASGTNNSIFTLNRSGRWDIRGGLHWYASNSVDVRFHLILNSSIGTVPAPQAWGGLRIPQVVAGSTHDYDSPWTCLDYFAAGTALSLGCFNSGANTVTIDSGALSTGYLTWISFEWVGP